MKVLSLIESKFKSIVLEVDDASTGPLIGHWRNKPKTLYKTVGQEYNSNRLGKTLDRKKTGR